MGSFLSHPPRVSQRCRLAVRCAQCGADSFRSATDESVQAMGFDPIDSHFVLDSFWRKT